MDFFDSLLNLFSLVEGTLNESFETRSNKLLISNGAVISGWDYKNLIY